MQNETTTNTTAQVMDRLEGLARELGAVGAETTEVVVEAYANQHLVHGIGSLLCPTVLVILYALWLRYVRRSGMDEDVAEPAIIIPMFPLAIVVLISFAEAIVGFSHWAGAPFQVVKELLG